MGFLFSHHASRNLVRRNFEYLCLLGHKLVIGDNFKKKNALAPGENAGVPPPSQLIIQHLNILARNLKWNLRSL